MGTRQKLGRGEAPDYRRYLDDRLTQARHRVTATDAVTGVALISVAAVCYVLAAIMLDQWFEFSGTVRLLFLLGFVVVSAAFLVRWVILPSLRKVNPLFAARQVEAVDPKMKNSVTSYVELVDRRGEIPDPIFRTIESKAASDLARVKIEDAIQSKHVLPALYLLAAVIVIFCAYSFFTTKSFASSFQRVLLPLADIAPPTATRLRFLFDPGLGDGSEPAPLAAGSAVTIKAGVVRGHPNQIKGYVRAEGSDYEEPHDFQPTRLATEFTLTLPQRQKNFVLRVEADDYRSPEIRFHVTPAPMVRDWLVRYQPPAYTGEGESTSTSPEIDGIEGTVVQIEATANVAVDAGSARIELRLNDVDSTVEMKLAEGSSNRLVGEWTLTKEGTYSISFRDRNGRVPEFRPKYPIRVRKDLPPTVVFEQPGEKEIDWPVDRPLPLRARVSDDFGLRRVELLARVQSTGKPVLEREEGGAGARIEGEAAFDERLDLTQAGVQPGDVIEYEISADDNKLPVSQTTSTHAERRLVRVVAPPPRQESAPEESEQQQVADAREQPQGAKGSSEGEGDPEAKEGKSSQQGGSNSADDPSMAQSDSENESSEGSSEGTGQGSSESSASQSKQGKEASSARREGGTQQEDERDLKRLEEFLKRREQNSDSQGDSSSSSDPQKQNSSSPAGGNDESSPTGQGNDSKRQDATSSRNESGSDQKEGKEGSSASDSSDGKDSSDRAGASNETGSKANSNESSSEGENSAGGEPRPSADSQRKAGSERSAAEKQGSKEGSEEQGNTPDESKGNADAQQGAKPSDQGSEGSDSAGAAGEKKSPTKDGSEPMPTPEGSPQDSSDSSERSHKQGSDNAAASEQGSSAGSSSPGESGTEGESNSGSPSDPSQAEEGKPSSTGTPTEEKQPGQESSDSAKSPTSGTGGEEQQGKADSPSNEDSAPDQEGSKPSAGDPKNASPSSRSDGPMGESSTAPGEGEQGKGSEASESAGDQPKSGSEGEASKGSSPSQPEGDPKSPEGSGSSAGDQNKPSGQEAKNGSAANDNPTGNPKPAGSSGDASNGPPATDNRDGTGQGDPPPQPELKPDEVNQEDLGEGSNLTLRQIEDELSKKKIDPELLKEMGWTEEEARKFRDRLKEPQVPKEKADPLTGESRREFGSGTDLRKSTGRSGGTTNDAVGDLFSGRRGQVPPEVRKRFEAYMKSLSETPGAAAEKAAAAPRAKE